MSSDGSDAPPPPASKRNKPQPGEDALALDARITHCSFAPGSIKKIELTNFMVHEHTVLYP